MSGLRQKTRKSFLNERVGNITDADYSAITQHLFSAEELAGYSRLFRLNKIVREIESGE